MIRVWLGAVLVWLPGAALAATLEVGPGKTYATIQAGFDAAAAGDTVLVFASTYTDWLGYTNPYYANANTIVHLDKSGTAGNPITLRANSSGVILDAQNVRDSCFAGVSRSYIVIDGFECVNTNIAGTLAGSINPLNGNVFTIQNNTISNIVSDADHGDQTAINIQDLDNSLIRNNTITPSQAPYGAIGIRGSGGASNTIENNTITGSWLGIYISQNTNDYIIRNNSISGHKLHGIWIRDCVRAKVSYNVVENTGAADSTGIILLDQYEVIPNENHEVYNNVIRGTQQGIFLGDQDGSFARNNIFMGTVWGVTDAWWNGFTPSTGVVLDYNLFYSVTNNYYQASGFAGTHNLYATNPLFLATGNKPNPYYTLQAASPAINVGDPTSPAGTDFVGAATPQGGQMDLGAFEYATAAAAGTIAVRGMMRGGRR